MSGTIRSYIFHGLGLDVPLTSFSSFQNNLDYHLQSLMNLILFLRSNIVSDNKHMMLGLSDGSLYCISWKGEVMDFMVDQVDNDLSLHTFFPSK